MSNYSEEFWNEVNNENKDDKKNSFGKVFLIIFFSLLFLWILFYNFRQINLKNRLKSYYGEKFKVETFEIKPESKENTERFDWYGEEIKSPLFYFMVLDTSGEKYGGYADFFGFPILDDYAEKYFQQDMIDLFADTVDFEKDFPDVQYYVSDFTIARYSYTKDNTDFDGFMHNRSVISPLWNGGYPYLIVILESTDYDTVTRIKKKLRKSDFPIYLCLYGADEFDDDVSLDDFFSTYSRVELGDYFPLGYPYDSSMLGISYVDYRRNKYKDENSDVASIQLLKKDELIENYIIYGDGTVVKETYSGNSMEENSAVLSNDDYSDIYRFYAEYYSDIYSTVREEVRENDVVCDVYKHQGWIYGQIEGAHMDSDFDYEFDEETFNYNGEEKKAYKLYSGNRDNEDIKPVLDILSKYF